MEFTDFRTSMRISLMMMKLMMTADADDDNDNEVDNGLMVMTLVESNM